ncbi:MAG: TaqI-like C-terminal specificity domain-containing protein [Desulfatiglandales bacterium]
MIIKSHLDQYISQLKRRQDKGVTPYNLRNCAYLEQFEKEKIVWGNLALSCQFALVAAGLYINAPSPLIGGGDRFLLVLLNSTVADFYIRSLGVTRNGGYFEYKPMFVEKLPIPKVENERKEPFQTLANYVLLTAESEQKLLSAYFEQVIDGLVYELYFPNEINAAGKEILPHLGKLAPLTAGMSEAERLAIIRREFDRLYDPRHPVRNHVETLDSVEVVKIIRDALKR